MSTHDSARDAGRLGSPVVDPAGRDMGSILALGAAWGIPVLFLATLVICLLDGLSWGGSAAISAWGGIVGGPFFGAMVFYGKRVGRLSH